VKGGDKGRQNNQKGKGKGESGGAITGIRTRGVGGKRPHWAVAKHDRQWWSKERKGEAREGGKTIAVEGNYGGENLTGGDDKGKIRRGGGLGGEKQTKDVP